MKKKVLIADDEPHIRLLLEQTLDDLAEQGVEILTASNGAEALAIVDAERPQLVLLDVNMPLLSGFEVCRAIKGRPDLQGITVVMLTAKGQEFDRATGAEVGADHYVTKPFDPDELLQRALQVLARAG